MFVTNMICVTRKEPIAKLCIIQWTKIFGNHKYKYRYAYTDLIRGGILNFFPKTVTKSHL